MRQLYLDMFGREGLDRRLRADGREEVAVRCGEYARARAVVFGGDLEFEHEGNYNGRGWRLEIRFTRRWRLILFRGHYPIFCLTDNE